jgi:hypothetical protein
MFFEVLKDFKLSIHRRDLNTHVEKNVRLVMDICRIMSGNSRPPVSQIITAKARRFSI